MSVTCLWFLHACTVCFCVKKVQGNQLLVLSLLQSAGPYKVTIVNREYHAGRHIVNTDQIAREINAMEQVNCT